MKTIITGKQFSLLISILWIGLLASCSCTSLQENNPYYNSVKENKHEVAIAKDSSAMKILHEKIAAYEQHNAVFGHKVISLIVPPDTTDLLSFSLEDSSVQMDLNAVEYTVEIDDSVEMQGEFACLTVKKKMECEIEGLDAISMGEKKFDVKLRETPSTKASIILRERSSIQNNIASYISVISQSGVYDVRNISGELPDGYSVAIDDSVEDVNESYTLNIDPETVVKANLVFSHSYHYVDISSIDVLSDRDISLSFSKMPETGKVSCQLFDIYLEENGGYLCVIDPTKKGSGSIDFTFNNTYVTDGANENGTYRLNY